MPHESVGAEPRYRWAVLGVSTGVNALAWGTCSTFALVVSAVGFGMRIAQLSAIPADVFAGPHLGAILGVVQAGGGLGDAIGPFLGGWLFDMTGSYGAASAAASLAVAGSGLAVIHAARPPYWVMCRSHPARCMPTTMSPMPRMSPASDAGAVAQARGAGYADGERRR